MSGPQREVKFSSAVNRRCTSGSSEYAQSPVRTEVTGPSRSTTTASGPSSGDARVWIRPPESGNPLSNVS
jgi:hypothetical protein